MVKCRSITTLSASCFVFYIASAVPTVQSLKNMSGPVVLTSVGPIRGHRAEEGDYSMFMGIPYAKLDENNIFGPAIPYPRFERIFDAFDDTAMCPQIEEFNRTIVGTLECLHLNVYIPNSARADNMLPVLVWIHGGAFSFGNAGRFLYGPNYLIKHGIIIVTLNYRLGAYGFMCPDIPEVPGNQGLKDQILAMRWVKENIGAFGGDNTRITLAGNSAGALSVDLHLQRERNENLFQKVILQSGVSSMQRKRNANPANAMELAKYFNHTSNSLKDALNFLASVETDKLIAAVNETGLSFGPCIEKIYSNAENVIIRDTLNADLSRVKDIDVMIGFTLNESLFMLPLIMNGQRDIMDKTITNKFNFKSNGDLYTEMKEIVSQFYFGDAHENADVKEKVLDMVSDFNFKYPILQTVQKYLDNSVKTLYLYLFSYSGGRNVSKRRLNIEGVGAAHGDELGYLFDVSFMENPSPEDQLIIDRITNLWANFVKYGNPTPEVTRSIPLRWPRVTPSKWYYLNLDSKLRIGTRPYHDRMAFLDLLHKLSQSYEMESEHCLAFGVDFQIFYVIFYAFILSYSYLYTIGSF